MIVYDDGAEVELRTLARGEWRCGCGAWSFSLKECGVPVSLSGRCYYCGDNAEVIPA